MTRFGASLTCIALASGLLLRAQSPAVYQEAEGGARGAEINVATDGAVQYVTASTDSAGNNPASAARVITLTVTFPAAGTYELFARVRVGPGGANDDSFFHGNGFGAKSPDTDADWILVNQLSGVGFVAGPDIVAATGTAGTGVWKWINLSVFNGGETPITFAVPAGALTQTLQVGARENGLDLDQLAFGRSGLAFTVSNLDNREPGTPSTPDTGFTPPGPPLAFGKTKWLGSAYSSPTQTLNFDKYWNQVVPENAGKWGSVEGTRDVMNWGALDAAHDFAQANNFPFRLHVLLWGSQQPAWIESLPAAEQLEEIEEWFAAVAARYPGLDIIEVVNEPLHDPPNGAGNGNYYNALGGAGASGWDWVLNAFRRARTHFPNARLMLNDYSITNSAASTQSYLTIINLLKAENLIHAIGVQGHAFSTTVSAASMRANLDTLAGAGLPIYVTELDIDGPSDQVQLDEYRRIFPVFWEHSAVRGVTLWGWRPGLWRNSQGAFLVLDAGAERPAMAWLRSYVQGDLPVIVTPPSRQSVVAGDGVTLSATAGGMGTFTYQWRHNGVDLPTATAATHTIANIAPAQAGTYSLAVTNSSGTTVSPGAVVGVEVPANAPGKVIGTGYEFAADIVHGVTGYTYDQVLLTGAAATIRCDPGEIVRTSFVDMNDDIVQVEFSGAGHLTITLAGVSGPATAVNYNQPSVQYVKGHPTITLVGADESSHLSVFSVGTITAVNQSLFKPEVTYDGVAGVQLISLSSPTGRMGSLRTANTEVFGSTGLTGLYAPGVRFGGPANVHNVSALDTATPVLVTGTIDTGRIGITGGDMLQLNGGVIQVGDAQSIAMLAGTSSHNVAQPAQTNRGVYEREGVNVTATLVVNP